MLSDLLSLVCRAVCCLKIARCWSSLRSESDFLRLAYVLTLFWSMESVLSLSNLMITVFEFPLPRTSQDEMWHFCDKAPNADSSATGKLQVSIVSGVCGYNITRAENVAAQMESKGRVLVERERERGRESEI